MNLPTITSTLRLLTVGHDNGQSATILPIPCTSKTDRLHHQHAGIPWQDHALTVNPLSVSFTPRQPSLPVLCLSPAPLSRHRPNYPGRLCLQAGSNNNNLLYHNFSFVHSRSFIQVRQFSTDDKKKNDTNMESAEKAEEPPPAIDAHSSPTQTSDSVSSTATSQSPPNFAGIPNAPARTAAELAKIRQNFAAYEATMKKVAEQWNTGDLLSVYSIVALIVIIVTSPFVIRYVRVVSLYVRVATTTKGFFLGTGDDFLIHFPSSTSIVLIHTSHMRRSDSTYEDLDPEDPVTDLAAMIRGEYFGPEDGDAMSESGRSSLGLDRIVADLLKSPQVEQAVMHLVTQVIQAPQFKRACQALLKELWKDLVEDEETLKQVVHLLQNAIQDEKIKEAAIQLVMEVFGDDLVLEELVALVQRLGVEKQVQQATQALLVESAHNALNDPEILDHSMEFATDVVGDDVVQQTAGEALYNTLSYAVRPTLSVCESHMMCKKWYMATRVFTEEGHFSHSSLCLQQFCRFWGWDSFPCQL